ncbi:MAG: hypothetical protein ACJASX_003892 [Limisphaerales bacterium]
MQVADLSDGVYREIVPPATDDVRVTDPFFYGDQIIYYRKRGIWITDVEGKKHERLFPPDKPL